MVRDPDSDNRKCGRDTAFTNVDAAFTVKGRSANRERCLGDCLKNKHCVAVSGKFNAGPDSWCIGCKIHLWNLKGAAGAKAFRKDDIGKLKEEIWKRN